MGKTYLEQTFNEVLQGGDGIFVPYIMAGDGGLEHLIDQLEQLEKAGATAVELGIPFSDPVADGPTIQAAGKRALDSGVTLRGIMEVLKVGRARVNIPIIFMTYMNPIFRYGIDEFLQDCQKVGVDGLIIPDLPFEHNDIIKEKLELLDIALIQLASLTSPEDRLKLLAEHTEGFLYAITVNGTTGSRNDFHQSIKEHITLLKTYSKVPVLAGFGISSVEHVREFLGYADGVVVGSKIIELLAESDTEQIQKLIQAVKKVSSDK